MSGIGTDDVLQNIVYRMERIVTVFMLKSWWIVSLVVRCTRRNKKVLKKTVHS